MKWRIEFEGENYGWGCPCLLEVRQGPNICRIAAAKHPGIICPGLGNPGCPAKPVEDNRINELETQLEAWYTVFGTTQLSHAQARLEQAEKLARRAKPVEEGKCRWTWQWDEVDRCNWWFTDCGHKMDDVNKYCPHCGKGINEEAK